MNPQNIPMEDDPCDVLGKAMRGQDIDLTKLSQITGIESTKIQSQLDGNNDPVVLEKIAPALGLSPAALINLPSYCPGISAPDGLQHFVSPFGHAGVNAFVITQGNQAIVIDTGTDASGIRSFIKQNSLHLNQLLITHRHADHIACIGDFKHINIIYPEQTAHGDTIETTCGSVTALDVSGHIIPARAYFYQELDTPICIVGDSIFAGSIGGTKHPDHYPIALRTAKDHIMSLDENTVLCPGHGPLTTVHSELANNPFFK